MRIRVWGCRGSLAAPGADTLRYGGNTSCVEVRGDNGEVLVLDAGTGMRPLGVAMANDGASRIDILLSHLHLDHLQGLGFFRPLFVRVVRSIYGVRPLPFSRWPTGFRRICRHHSFQCDWPTFRHTFNFTTLRRDR